MWCPPNQENPFKVTLFPNSSHHHRIFKRSLLRLIEYSPVTNNYSLIFTNNFLMAFSLQHTHSKAPNFEPWHCRTLCKLRSTPFPELSFRQSICVRAKGVARANRTDEMKNWIVIESKHEIRRLRSARTSSRRRSLPECSCLQIRLISKSAGDTCEEGLTDSLIFVAA